MLFRHIQLGTLLLASLTQANLFGQGASENQNPSLQGSHSEPIQSKEDSIRQAMLDLQGEYLGVIDSWEGNWGAQVIALGEGKLKANLIKGGLPGESGQSFERTVDLTIGVSDGTFSAVGQAEDVQLTLRDGRLVISSLASTTPEPASENGALRASVLGTLTRIVRESKTLGLPVPENGVALFNDEANRFTGAKEVAATDSDDALRLGVGGRTDVAMESHRLHIEFRTPFMPEARGQARGNSGVYVQGRYEVQILDSFGLTGEANECGGVYGMSKPRLNMCYPPTTWQTYDIDFYAAQYDDDGNKTQNATMIVRHNGVLIHENLDLSDATPGNQPEGPKPGALYLQDHGDSVEFRNVWFVSLPPQTKE